MRFLLLLASTTYAFRAPAPRSLAPARLRETLHQTLLRQKAPLVRAASPLETAVAANSALAAVGIATKQQSLTPSGLAHSWALGVILLSSFVGWKGYSLCVFYLVAGSAATKVRKAQKEAAGIGERGQQDPCWAGRRA